MIGLPLNTYASYADPEEDSLARSWSMCRAPDAREVRNHRQRRNASALFRGAPDYESPGDSGANNVYEVTVVVTDTKGNTDEQAVMVKVTNEEEDGEITLSTLQPRVGFPVTATLTDPDNVNADSVEWQWYRGATITIGTDFDPTELPQNECDGAITMNCSIKGATSAVYVPVAGDAGESLTAVATYTDGNGDGKDYAAKAELDPLVNTINDAPVFPDQDANTEGRQTAQTREVAENIAAGADIGPSVGTGVKDEDTVLTYSLGGPDAASFDIVRRYGPAADQGSTGQRRRRHLHGNRDGYGLAGALVQPLRSPST